MIIQLLIYVVSNLVKRTILKIVFSGDPPKTTVSNLVKRTILKIGIVFDVNSLFRQ